jgi:hypothetical protein
MLGTIVNEHLQNWRNAMGSTKATALAVGAVWLGLGVTGAWSQTTGPITKDVATAAKAKTVTPTDCVTGCKKRGKVKSEDCAPKWCSSGQCYRSTQGAYCVK